MGVGLVFVSHSAKIAEGLIELASQMAPTAAMAAAGGMDDGGIGTSFELVQNAIATVESGAGAVILCDLGSAILTAETALDFLDDAQRERVRIVDAPLIEGAVAASVAAETGADLDEVVRAAESAWGEHAAVAAAEQSAEVGAAPGAYVRTVALVNADGLHARPAAEFAKLAATFNSHVTVNGKDARSLLGIMSLGLTKGATAEISSADGQAHQAVDALAALIESGFGEA